MSYPGLHALRRLRIIALILGLCFLNVPANGQEHSKPLFRDFIGLNGHTVQFKPELYKEVCQVVRDYHPMDWDTGPDTDYKLDFPFARNRVSWDHVYTSWKKHGFNTDACIMFETIPHDKWKDLERDARRYGKLFAESFGPSSKLANVQSVEIGNEPGKYSDASYRRVFESMARGFREGDPKLKIVTCNVNAKPSGDYHKSVECVSGLEQFYDVLNIHSYAQLENWPTWKRSFPEDVQLKDYFGDIDSLIDWRDKNAKGKEVWVTEFGWDCSTKKPMPQGDFAKWVGNSDDEQAQWIVRSFFLFAKRDIQRAYIYFFNDNDTPQLHGASGLTRDFNPKPSFHAVAHLYRTLGEYRFSKIIQERDDCYVYEFQSAANANEQIWVVWSPTGNKIEKRITLDLQDRKPIKAQRMPLVSGEVPDVPLVNEKNKATFVVNESPIYVWLASGR